MTVGSIDRRTAILFGAAVAAILLLRVFVLSDRSSSAVVTAVDSAPLAERRLERLRQIAASVPGKESLVQKVSAELNSREKGLIKAETRAQAEATLQALLHHLGELNGIDIRGHGRYAHQAAGQRIRRGQRLRALHLPHRATGELPGRAGQRTGDALHQPDPGERHPG